MSRDTTSIAVKLSYAAMYRASGSFVERMALGRRVYHHARRTAKLTEPTAEESAALIAAYLEQRPPTQCEPAFAAPSQASINFPQPYCQPSPTQRDSAG